MELDQVFVWMIVQGQSLFHPHTHRLGSQGQFLGGNCRLTYASVRLRLWVGASATIIIMLELDGRKGSFCSDPQ